MAVIRYVDLEGSAGTGDGTSFANRAGSINDLNSGSAPLSGSTGVADIEVRIKKSPDPTSLGSGKVTRTPPWYRGSYDGTGWLSIGSSYCNWSSTAGATQFNYSNHGLQTGDWIEILGNTWYYGSNQYSDRMDLNGLWKITKVDKDWFKLDDYVSPLNDGTNTQPSYGSNGYWWKVTSAIVELATVPWKNVACWDQGRTKWTAESNVTTYDPDYTWSSWTTPNDWINPSAIDKIEISSSFTTGKVAYYQLPSALDLSDYEQISLTLSWRSGSPLVLSNAPGKFSLRLCTDTAGATSVHTMVLDTTHSHSQASYHMYRLKKDFGTALNSSIQSVALYLDDRNGDTSSFKLGLSNIVACKAKGDADSVALDSLIGLNTTDDPFWWPVQYLDEDKKAIKCGCAPYAHRYSAGAHHYYTGPPGCKWSASNASATIYKRDCIKLEGSTTTTNQYSGDYAHNGDNSGYVQKWWDIGAGTSSSTAKVSGGWNSTDMSTKTSGDMTWVDGVTGAGGFVQGAQGSADYNYQELKDIGEVRCFGTQSRNSYPRWTNIRNVGCYSCPQQNSQNSQGFDMPQLSFPYSMPYMIGNYQNQGPSTDKTRFKLIAPMCGLSQTSAYIGYIDNLNWELIDFEYGRPPDIYERNNWTIDLLKYGYWGYSMSGVYTQIKGEGNTIKKWESVDNGIYIHSSASGCKIEDFEYESLNTTGSNGASTDYLYSGSTNTYAIQFTGNGCDVLDGTTDKPFDIRAKEIKIKGIVLTGNDHTVNSDDGSSLLSADHNGVSGAGKYYGYQWTMEPETTTRHTASGKAWKFKCLSTSYDAVWPVGKIAVASGGTFTVKVWMYKPTTDTAKLGRLVIKSDSSIGLTQDVVSNNSASNGGTWTEHTCVAYPNAAGIITINLEYTVDSTGDYVIFDDMTITQT